MLLLLLCLPLTAQSIRVYDAYLDPVGNATNATCTVNGGSTPYSRVTAGVIDWTVPALTSPALYTVVCSWLATGTTTTEYWRPLAANGLTQTLAVVRIGGGAGATLSVSPSSTQSAVAGGSAIAFTASVVVAWTKSGVGSLSSSNGTSTLYTPPLTLVSPATVTITATAGAQVVTRTIDVAASAAAEAPLSFSAPLNRSGNVVTLPSVPYELLTGVPPPESPLTFDLPLVRTDDAISCPTCQQFAATPTPCGAGQYVSAVAADGALTCSVPLSATSSQALTDMNAVKVSDSVMTLNSSATAETPTRIRSGGNLCVYSSTITATKTAGSGDGVVDAYVASDCTLSLRSQMEGLAISCSGCSFAAGSVPPDGIVPLWQWSIASGAWVAPDNTAKKLAYLSADAPIELSTSGSGAATLTVAPGYRRLNIPTPAGGSDSFKNVNVVRFSDNVGLSIAADNYPMHWFRYDPSTAGTVTYVNTNLASLPAYSHQPANSTIIYSYGRGGSAIKFPDMFSVSNFRPFWHFWRLAFTSTTSAKYWVGWCDSRDTATPQNCLLILYDASIDGNIKCAVIAGGSLYSTDIVAADTSYHSLILSASASGTLTCSVDSTTVTRPTTFPVATNWYFVWGQQATTASTRAILMSEMRSEITMTGR